MELLDTCLRHGVGRGKFLAVVIGREHAALACEAGSWSIATDDPAAAVRQIDERLRPRWVWWSSATAAVLTAGGTRVATCWDLAAVQRLLYGGWQADPATQWAALNDLPTETIPSMGQLGLLDDQGTEGTDLESATRPDGHLRPEWASGGWETTPERMATWAATALRASRLQRALLSALPRPVAAGTVARSESGAELLCCELAADGLPIDVGRAESIIAESIGPRPRNEGEMVAAREHRDEPVLALAPTGSGTDLRNPAHVRSMLAAAGIDVADTRKWRLEPLRGAHPLVDALLLWRKAERIATTYGYNWLDEHVGADGRLRGTWTGSDGAAGRMTAQAGLHNLPADMRDAVAAEAGHVFVHADLGQIEPRVLAAVSADPALTAATGADDLYAPVAARLGVTRPVAKVAVLAAMYGQTSGTAGEALRGMESAYPVAMQFLREADRNGRTGTDVRTYGCRIVRMRSDLASFGAVAAQGRYARNAVIQGAAAELFKAWAVTVRGRVSPLGARIVLCLHDELLVHVPEEHATGTAELLETSLADAAALWMPGSNVRYVATANIVVRWSEAK